MMCLAMKMLSNCMHCIIISRKDKKQIIARSFPTFRLGGNFLEFVFTVKHSNIHSIRNDDDDAVV